MREHATMDLDKSQGGCVLNDAARLNLCRSMYNDNEEFELSKSKWKSLSSKLTIAEEAYYRVRKELGEQAPEEAVLLLAEQIIKYLGMPEDRVEEARIYLNPLLDCTSGCDEGLGMQRESLRSFTNKGDEWLRYYVRNCRSKIINESEVAESECVIFEDTNMIYWGE